MKTAREVIDYCFSHGHIISYENRKTALEDILSKDATIQQQAEQIAELTKSRDVHSKVRQRHLVRHGRCSRQLLAVVAENQRQAEQIRQANDVADACREASTMLKAENQRLKQELNKIKSFEKQRWEHIPAELRGGQDNE